MQLLYVCVHLKLLYNSRVDRCSRTAKKCYSFFSTLIVYHTRYEHAPHVSPTFLPSYFKNRQSITPGVHGISRRDRVGRTEKTYTPGVTSPHERQGRIAERPLEEETRHAPAARELSSTSSSRHEHGSNTPVDRSHGLGQAREETRWVGSSSFSFFLPMSRHRHRRRGGVCTAGKR